MPSDFEKAFSDLSYAFLQQSGLNVADYLVGFEIADKNDKQTKGVGFFVLKIGNKYYYVPTFFNNGEIKPLLMMYDQKADMFLPLNQEWLDFLEKSIHPEIGESAPIPKLMGMPLNIRNFMQPPFSNRAASLRFPELVKQSSFDLKQKLLNLVMSNKPFLKAACSVYGVDELKSMLTYDVSLSKNIDPVRLVTDMGEAESLPMQKKAEFLKKGYAIIDDRDPEKVVATYELQYKGHECSPKESGIYDVMTQGGKKKCFIALGPMSLGRKLSRSRATVVELDSKKSDELLQDQIVVYDNDESPYDRISEVSLVNIKNMKPNTEYMIINTSGIGNADGERCRDIYGPMEVHRKTTGKDGNIYFSVSGRDFYGDTSVIVKSSGNLSWAGKDVMIPADKYKALEMSRDPLHLVTRPHLEYDIDDEYGNYKMASDSLFLNGRFLKKFASQMEAEYALISELGLSDYDAAKYSGGGEFFVKKAFVPDLPGIGGLSRAMIGMEAPGGTTEPEYMSYSGENKAPVSGLVADSDSLKREIDKAVGLSEMGMKDVFDGVMVGTLAKITDIGSELKSYIPGLIKGLDKVARTLFIFWYRGDKIKEKYTLNEFSETEDLLKDTFKNLGSIVLDLKKKFSPTE